MTPEELTRAGFSPEEVGQYTQLQGAGFSDDEIVQHLSGAPPKPQTPQAKYYGMETQAPPKAGEFYPNNRDVISRGNTRLAEGVHKFHSDLLPAVGGIAGEMGALSAGLPGLGLGSSALIGLGMTAGEKGSELLDTAFGYRTPFDNRKKGALRETAGTVGDVAKNTTLAYGFGKATKLMDYAIWENPDVQKLLKGSVKKFYEVFNPKNTSTGLDDEKIITHIGSVVRRRGNINLPEDVGFLASVRGEGANLTRGKLPSNRLEEMEATSQAMKLIHEEYNNMAKEAGSKGMMVDMEPVAKSLYGMLTEGRQIAVPESSEFIKKLAGRLTLPPKADPVLGLQPGGYKQLGIMDTQDALKFWNEIIEPFMKNPTSADASKVATLAEAARAMRGALYAAVEAAEGAGYSQLRREYGAHTALFDDIKKQAQRQLKLSKEELDMYDIYATSLIAGAVAGGNPAGFAKAPAVTFMKSVMKYLKDPDTKIKQMYTMADRAYRKGALRVAEKEAKVEGQKLLPSGVGPLPSEAPQSALRLTAPPAWEGQAPSPMSAMRSPHVTVAGNRFIPSRGAQEAGTEAEHIFPRWERQSTGYMRPLSKQETLAELGKSATQIQRGAEESAWTLSRMPPTPRLDATDAFLPSHTSPSTLGKKGKVTYNYEMYPEQRTETNYLVRERGKNIGGTGIPKSAGRSAAVFEEAFRQANSAERKQFLNGLKGKQLQYFKELSKELDAIEKTEASTALIGKK